MQKDCQFEGREGDRVIMLSTKEVSELSEQQVMGDESLGLDETVHSTELVRFGSGCGSNSAVLIGLRSKRFVMNLRMCFAVSALRNTQHCLIPK